MTFKKLILIISIFNLLIQQVAYAGFCTEYLPQIVSLDAAQPKYLMYKDKWAAVVSPIVNIASNQTTPVSILSELSKHKLIEVRMAVANNPKTPPNILDVLFKDKNFNVRASTLCNPIVKVQYFEFFLDQSDVRYHESLADCQNTPSQIIEKLYTKYNNSSRNTIIGKIASNPNTPEWILKEIFKLKTNWTIYLKIGKNPKIINEIVTVGKTGSLKALREKYGLLSNDNFFERTITYILHRQATERFTGKVGFPVNLLINIDNAHPNYVMIRETYAKDESIPPTVMENLINEIKLQDNKKHYKLNIEVIVNPKLPKKELDEFCQSKDYPILIRVASNPNITPDCIKTLTSDFIRNGKLDLRVKDDYKMYSGRRHVISNLLTNPATPENILYSTLDYAKQYYYEDGLLHKTITALLLRPEVPINGLLIYLKNKENKLITGYSLHGSEIDDPVSNSPRGMGLIIEFRQILNKRLDKLQTIIERENFLKFAAKSESSILRAYVAGNLLTPPSILEKLADDESLLVKLELAKNNNISEGILRKLANDKTLIVFEVKDCSFE